jgi:hypothetical protein
MSAKIGWRTREQMESIRLRQGYGVIKCEIDI